MYKTYKVNLTKEEETFLDNRRKQKGITLQHQITEAVKMYIEAVKVKEGAQNA